MFFPHEQLTFVNSYNGLVSYPLNQSSFETATEYEEIEDCINMREEIIDTIDNSKNYINSYKKFFPKWLYDSFIRHIGVNKWNMRQSKLSRYTLKKEININLLDEIGSGTLYRPKYGMKSLCEEMLDHENITVEELPINRAHRVLTHRYRDTQVIMMDNRVDQVCNFMSGSFDRISIKTETVTDPIIPECEDVDNGIIFTPMMESFCTVTKFGETHRITSEIKEDLNDTGMSIIIPTNNNLKVFAEYKKLLELYSGKKLEIGSSLVSTII